MWRGDGTFVRTSAATTLDEARNVEKGRIRIFLGPRLNVIFYGAEGCPCLHDWAMCSGITKENTPVIPVWLIWCPLLRLLSGTGFDFITFTNREVDKEYRFLRET